MQTNQLAFSTEKMSALSSDGFQVYQNAESNPSAEKFFKAGEAYDRSYESKWGDYIFAGGRWQEFIENFGLSSEFIPEEGAKKFIRESQESLVVSCECYIKALKQNPNHYFANLHLATALTAALQVEAAIPYWAKSLQLKSADTMRALVADSQGLNNKGVGTRLVTEYLGLGQLSYSNLLFNDESKIYGEIALRIDNALNILRSLSPQNYKQTSVQFYVKQRKFANNLLMSSPLVRNTIEYLDISRVSKVK